MFEAKANRLKTESGVWVKAKEAAAKAFATEKLEIVKESEDLKRKVEKIKANSDLIMGKDDKLRLEVLTSEQKHSLSEVGD